jgi:AraC family transcriptional regulator
MPHDRLRVDRFIHDASKPEPADPRERTDRLSECSIRFHRSSPVKKLGAYQATLEYDRIIAFLPGDGNPENGEVGRLHQKPMMNVAGTIAVRPASVTTLKCMSFDFDFASSRFTSPNQKRGKAVVKPLANLIVPASRLFRRLGHVLIDQDRVSVWVVQHEVRDPRGRLVGLHEQRDVLILERFLYIPDVVKLGECVSRFVPAGIEREHVLLKHPLKQADLGFCVFQYHPVLGKIAADLAETELLIKRQRGVNVFDGQADTKIAETHVWFSSWITIDGPDPRTTLHFREESRRTGLRFTGRRPLRLMRRSVGVPHLHSTLSAGSERACQILRISEKPRQDTQATYAQRVNLAIDHIVGHLDERLRLQDLSRVAMLSPFHFHRVFQAIVGSTPSDFVNRLRLEKALLMISTTPGLSLTSVALACGFSSPSDFSRSFRRRFGVAPRDFDLDGRRQAQTAELEAIVAQTTRSPHVERLPSRQNPDRFRVKIRDLPARTVAYIRVDKPYRGDGVVKAAERLVSWAERNGLANGQWLGYQWDNPKITALDDCRYYVAVEADRFTAKGELARYRFPAMVVAQLEIRGGLDLEMRGLQWLYGSWLPRSGYVPDDQPCFEAWIGRPFAHGMDYFELHVQLPIRRAGTEPG